MKKGEMPGHDAVIKYGWLRAHRWLIARRLTQLFIFVLFLLGPLAGVWIVKGNLSASMTLDVLPLTDPFLLLQTLFAGHPLEMTAGIGGLIVAVFYALVGGRVYCAWVCPINPITDAAAWLRQKLGLKGSNLQMGRNTRYWILGLALLLPMLTGTLAWELLNPVSLLQRGIIFGFGLAWAVVLGIFFFDLFVTKRGWCSHLCPMGATYSLLGHKSLIRINANGRHACDDCMDCYAICPEPQILRPVLKGEKLGTGPIINSSACTNCGRCIDVCAQDVFQFDTRFNKKTPASTDLNKEVMP